MGSTGGTKRSYYDFRDIQTESWGSAHANQATEKFKEISNIQEWHDNLLGKQVDAIVRYTESGYLSVNKAQYNTPWEDMDAFTRERITNLHDALNGFELKNGIEVHRSTDFTMFGKEQMSPESLQQWLRDNGTTVQSDGFMSFSTKSDGVYVEGRGLVIHLRIPPSTGAGAYIAPMSDVQQESEFLVNNNTVMRFDPSSIHTDAGGNVHITADWLGRSVAQTISPTYTARR